MQFTFATFRVFRTCNWFHGWQFAGGLPTAWAHASRKLIPCRSLALKYNMGTRKLSQWLTHIARLVLSRWVELWRWFAFYMIYVQHRIITTSSTTHMGKVKTFCLEHTFIVVLYTSLMLVLVTKNRINLTSDTRQWFLLLLLLLSLTLSLSS